MTSHLFSVHCSLSYIAYQTVSAIHVALTHCGMCQAGAPQSLVKPSGRLDREVAADLGLAGAAQLGIKIGSQAKPAAAHPPSASKSPSSSSHRSQSQPSTSGRQVHVDWLSMLKVYIA